MMKSDWENIVEKFLSITGAVGKGVLYRAGLAAGVRLGRKLKGRNLDEVGDFFSGMKWGKLNWI